MKFTFPFLILLLSCNTSVKKTTTKEETSCISSFKIDDHTNINKEYIYNGYIDWNAFRRQEKIKSDTIRENYITIDSTNFYHPTTLGLFAIDSSTKTMIVNTNLVSDITRTSAIKSKEDVSITTIKEGALVNKEGVKELIQLFMYMEVIETYMHLHADVCLTKEEESDKDIALTYKITHHFCTNECQDETEISTFVLNKASGELVMN